MGIINKLFGRKKVTNNKQIRTKLVETKKSTESTKARKAYHVRPNIEQLKRKNSLEGLIRAIGYDKDDSVRADAAFALGEIKADKRIVETLLRALGDESYLVVAGAARALGNIKDTVAVEPLIQVILSSEAFTARSNAVVALGEIKDTKAVEPLIQVLREDEFPEVRERAAWALREIKDTESIASLIQTLEDEDQNVRGEAAGALGDIGEPAVQPLIEALKDNSEDIRWGAAAVLGRIGDARAIEPLTQALKDESSNVREEAARALKTIDKGKEERKKEEGWKSYESKRYKICFSYPRNWRMERYQTGTIGFCDPEVDVCIELVVDKTADEQSFEDYIKEYKETYKYVAQSGLHQAGLDKKFSDAGLLEENDIAVSGGEGRVLLWRLFYQGQFKMHLHLCAKSDRHFFQLKCIAPDDLYEEYEDTFNRIIRSFLIVGEV